MKKSSFALLLSLLLALGLLFAVPVFAEGETGEEPFTLNLTFNRYQNYYDEEEENREWIRIRTLFYQCERGYDDDDFYYEEEYDEYGFWEEPDFTLVQISDDGNLEYGKDDFEYDDNEEYGYSYADLTKTYRFVVQYPLGNHVPNSESVIKVNGEAVEWEFIEGKIRFSLPVDLPAPSPLTISKDADLTITAGEEGTADTEVEFAEITSAITTDTGIISLENNGSWITYTGLKAGKATIFVTGQNGSTGSFAVTVKEEPPFELDCDSEFTIVAGDTDTAWSYRDYVKIASVTSSNTGIVKAKVVKDSYSGNGIEFTGLKPGKATLTVKGYYGAVEKYTVTVKSILKASSVTVNSKSSKEIGFYGGEVYDLIYMDEDNYTVTNSNKNAVKATKVNGGIKLTGKYPGTATITLKGPKGETSKIKITVKPALKTNTKTPVVKYGSTKISSSTTPGAKVTAKIGTRTYKATADAKGKYTITIPVVKIGTKITLKFTSGSSSLTKTITVKKDSSDIETTYWTYKNSTKVRGKAYKVHAGDYVKVTINGKTYKKTITKAASSLNFSIPIKKPGKYGIKMKTELFNKFGQQMAVENEYVYLSDVVHTGDTKAKVKWLTSWNDPDKINYYTYSEQWCYDWDGDGWHDAYLYFRNGRVSSWQVFE